MDSALVLDKPLTISDSKKLAIEEAKSKLGLFKLNAFKDILNNVNIEYDKTIDDPVKLLESLEKTLPKDKYKQVKEAYEKLSDELDKVMKDLINGSIDSFSNFMRNILPKIVEPLANGAVNSLAFTALINMAPTLESKILAGVVSGGIGTYKLIKQSNHKALISKETELNKILQEFEITKDDKDNIIDTRFNEEVQNTIRDYLKNNSIEFEDTGYLSLRNALYNLEFEKRLEIANIIKYKLGKTIDIEKTINKKGEKLTTRIKNGLLKPVSVGVGSGVGVATAVNSINPAILATPINTGLGWISTDFLVNLASKAPGILGTILSKIASYSSVLAGGLSIAGGFFTSTKAILSIENIAILAAAGGTLALLGVVGKKIVTGIKNKLDNRAYIKNRKKIDKLDEEKYFQENMEEMKKINDNIEKEKSSLAAMTIVNIVKMYAKELGIEIDQNINNAIQLREWLEKLDNKDKKKIIALLDELVEYNEKEPVGFLDYVKKIGMVILNATRIGLASLSVFDLLSGCGLISKIKNSELFSKIPGQKLDIRPTLTEGEELKTKVAEVKNSGESGSNPFIPATQSKPETVVQEPTALEPVQASPVSPSPNVSPTPTPTPSPTVPSTSVPLEPTTSLNNGTIPRPDEIDGLIAQKEARKAAKEAALASVGSFTNHLEMSSFANYIDRGDYNHIIEVFNSLEAASRNQTMYASQFFDWLYDYNSKRFIDFVRYFTEKKFEMTTNNYTVIAEVLVGKIQKINDVINAHNQFVKNVNKVGTGVGIAAGLATANNNE